MREGSYVAIIWAAVIVVAIVVSMRRRGRRHRIGAGAAGSIYDLLNEDRRKAVEIIVEERAGARDPEHRDGNLPELENPRQPPD